MRGVEEIIVPLRRVSPEGGHHWFGYYEKYPWDATGRYLLALHAGFFDRQPRAGEEAVVGLIDLHEEGRFTEIDRTSQWSWQQGAMMHWPGSAPDRQVVYNRLDEAGRPAAVVRDIHDGGMRFLPRPIYTLTRDGRRALSLDFGRLQRLRPGYGYAAPEHALPHDPAPADDGIYLLDMDTGDCRLTLSIAQLAQNRPRAEFAGKGHWVNHLQINPSGTRVAFVHRWVGEKGSGSFRTRLYFADLDGGNLILASDTGSVSHFDWRDDEHLLAWAADEQGDHRFYLFHHERGRLHAVGEGTMKVDGHCSYSPDRRWILNDTYPDAAHYRTLYLYRPEEDRRVDLGRFYSSELRGPIRCDLHPRWSRDGRQVCIDSAHEGFRAMYVLDVSEITG